MADVLEGPVDDPEAIASVAAMPAEELEAEASVAAAAAARRATTPRARPRIKARPKARSKAAAAPVSRKRGALNDVEDVDRNATAAASSTRKQVRMQTSVLSVFQALNTPAKAVYPPSLLVVAPTAADAREIALMHSPIKGSESLNARMEIHPIDITRPTVSFPGMGGPVTPLRYQEAASADGVVLDNLRIFMFEDFPFFQHSPPVALVIAPTEDDAKRMLTDKLLEIQAPKVAQQNTETRFTEIEVKPGVVVTLCTGLPPGLPSQRSADGDVSMA